MKRCLALLLTFALSFSLFACGGNSTNTDASTNTEVDANTDVESQDNEQSTVTKNDDTEIQDDAVVDPTENVDTVEVDKNLFSVELTVPADFVGEGTTQESLDAMVSENGFKSATLNSDGSVTYVMTKDQHKTMIEETKATIDEALAEMVTSGDYPNIVAIDANDDYTAFDVTLSTDTVGLAESFTAIGFYMFGGLYNVFNGTKADNISVSYINQATGEVIQTANSSDAQ